MGNEKGTRELNQLIISWEPCIMLMYTYSLVITTDNSIPIQIYKYKRRALLYRLCLELTKNIPVVLTSFPIIIWGKLVKGFMSCYRTFKIQTDKLKLQLILYRQNSLSINPFTDLPQILICELYRNVQSIVKQVLN